MGAERKLNVHLSSYHNFHIIHTSSVFLVWSCVYPFPISVFEPLCLLLLIIGTPVWLPISCDDVMTIFCICLIFSYFFTSLELIQKALLWYSLCWSLLDSQFQSDSRLIPALYAESPAFYVNIFPLSLTVSEMSVGGYP